MEISITPEIEASMISLAGKWAYKLLEDGPNFVLDVEKWSNNFENYFTAYYITLFRAIIKARAENKQKTVIRQNRKLRK